MRSCWLHLRYREGRKFSRVLTIRVALAMTITRLVYCQYAISTKHHFVRRFRYDAGHSCVEGFVNGGVNRVAKSWGVGLPQQSY